MMRQSIAETGKSCSFIIDTGSIELVIYRRNLLLLYNDVRLKHTSIPTTSITGYQLPIIGIVNIQIRKE